MTPPHRNHIPDAILQDLHLFRQVQNQVPQRRNFEEGVRIQAELTTRDIGNVTLRENSDTSDGSAAAKFFRQSILAQGAYQMDLPSERIKLGLDTARAGGKRAGRPPVLTQGNEANR